MPACRSCLNRGIFWVGLLRMRISGGRVWWSCVASSFCHKIFDTLVTVTTRLLPRACYHAPEIETVEEPECVADHVSRESMRFSYVHPSMLEIWNSKVVNAIWSQ
jgi:hypothetical protein